MQENSFRERITQALREGTELRLRLIKACTEQVTQAAQAIITCFRQGGKVLLFGNGGSAADAQHIAAEFVGRFACERMPLPALALTTDTSILTAVANDYGFDQVFARQIQALGKSGDMAIAISTSGKSVNMLAGVKAAREKGITTVGLIGGDGGELINLVDIPIVVPSINKARIQECHITIGHLLCEVVEVSLAAGELQIPQEGPTKSTSKVVKREELLELRKRWRTEKKTVVWTNGCFELLHLGHVQSLQAARALGNVLVVGVNSDDSVSRLKGSGHPIIPASERVEILAALECVDYVVVFDELTPEKVLAELKPDIHCKGADYAPLKGGPIPELQIVEAAGGRVEFLPLLPGHSTSDLIQRIQEISSEKGKEEN